VAGLDLGAAPTRSSAEPTGHVLQALAAAGQPGTRVIRAAVAHLLRMQLPDGCWPGERGTSDLAATCTVLPALIAAGVLRSKPPIQRAAAWLTGRQNPDGGWGPGQPASAGTRSGTSNPECTAGVLRALLAASGPDQEAIEQAVAWLISAQLPDGGWDGPQPAGLSRIAAPVGALGSYLAASAARVLPAPRTAPGEHSPAGQRPRAETRKPARPGRVPTSAG
jgi:squalene-hopene/tetraprenyl-beta-curcumene cyclase